MGKIPKVAHCCSIHFQASDYKNVKSAKKRLKNGAVPSINLPKRSHSPKVNSPKIEKMRKRAERAMCFELIRKELFHSDNSVTLSECSQTQSVDLMLHNSPVCQQNENTRNLSNDKDSNDYDLEAAHILLHLKSTQNATNGLNLENIHNDASKTENKSVQVNTFISQIPRSTVLNLLQTDRRMSLCCGISTFAKFEALVETCELLSIRTSQRPNFKLDLREILGLTLMKIKLDVSFSLLAPLFGVSVTTIITYFQFGVDLLYLTLKNVILWPLKEEIQNSMPNAFLQKYPNTRIILDCSESRTEKPNCEECRVRMYSHYKGAHTIKYLVGISPNGISFCSNVYGGKTSDQQIFSESTLVSKLEPGDGVMVDKGFLIDDLCKQHSLQLIRPPFLRNKTQLSAKESQENINIAKLRIHIEMVYQRIKVFHFFKNTVPLHLLHKCDKILAIVCALVNLDRPIIATDLL